MVFSFFSLIWPAAEGGGWSSGRKPKTSEEEEGTERLRRCSLCLPSPSTPPRWMGRRWKGLLRSRSPSSRVGRRASPSTQPAVTRVPRPSVRASFLLPGLQNPASHLTGRDRISRGTKGFRLLQITLLDPWMFSYHGCHHVDAPFPRSPFTCPPPTLLFVFTGSSRAVRL